MSTWRGVNKLDALGGAGIFHALGGVNPPFPPPPPCPCVHPPLFPPLLLGTCVVIPQKPFSPCPSPSSFLFLLLLCRRRGCDGPVHRVHLSFSHSLHKRKPCLLTVEEREERRAADSLAAEPNIKDAVSHRLKKKKKTLKRFLQRLDHH